MLCNFSVTDPPAVQAVTAEQHTYKANYAMSHEVEYKTAVCQC